MVGIDLVGARVWRAGSGREPGSACGAGEATWKTWLEGAHQFVEPLVRRLGSREGRNSGLKHSASRIGHMWHGLQGADIYCAHLGAVLDEATCKGGGHHSSPGRVYGLVR